MYPVKMSEPTVRRTVPMRNSTIARAMDLYGILGGGRSNCDQKGVTAKDEAS